MRCSPGSEWMRRAYSCPLARHLGPRSVKEWTDGGFAAVGDHLMRRGLRVIIVGTQRADNVVKACGEILDLSGLYKPGPVGGDTGPLQDSGGC